jgi:uncharacterized cupredoxin-like copper-binding protein
VLPRHVAAATLAMAVSVGPATAPVPRPGGSDVPKVVLTIHHSRFSRTHLRVPSGLVRFVVRNTDPIDHELIIGDRSVQDRHERGTEPRHPPRPGEVTVPAGTTAGTVYVFAPSGSVLFGCHLPGHWDYGMHGVMRVA